MRRFFSSAVCCLVLMGAGCPSPKTSKREPTAQASASAIASIVPAPPHADPIVLSDVRVPGLRVQSGTIRRSSLWGFSDLTVDLGASRLDIVSAPRGSRLEKLLPESGLAVINGGYFEADFKPSSWLKRDGIELAPKSDTSKGGVLALGAEGFYVGPFAGLGFEPRLAIQSHPLIVEAEGKLGIHRDDGRRAARTVVCVAEGNLHFILIAAPRGDGPTLFESAALLREPAPRGFGCTRALNLDGGPSSGVWFGPSVPARQRAPSAAVAYAIAVLPR